MLPRHLGESAKTISILPLSLRDTDLILCLIHLEGRA